MGANVFFIAFRQKPDIERLAALPGLSGFRLFKHRTKLEWYLEGPNPDGNTITFHQPLDYAPKGESFQKAQAAASKFCEILKRAALNPYGLNKRALATALTISDELGISTLLIDSNDDGVDAGFICEAGQVSHAKLTNLPSGVAVFESGVARHEMPKSEASIQGEPVLDLHQFASEVANKFFGESVRWRVTSDPANFQASDYILLSGNGERTPFMLPGDDIKAELWAIETSNASRPQKLRKSIRIIDRHVTAALDERLIASHRTERDLVMWNVTACQLHASKLRQPPSSSFETLKTYLQYILNYLQLLRPKPEFRRSLNFPAAARALRREWGILKLKLFFASIWE